jgi:hypothetical protein
MAKLPTFKVARIQADRFSFRKVLHIDGKYYAFPTAGEVRATRMVKCSRLYGEGQTKYWEEPRVVVLAQVWSVKLADGTAHLYRIGERKAVPLVLAEGEIYEATA